MKGLYTQLRTYREPFRTTTRTSPFITTRRKYKYRQTEIASMGDPKVRDGRGGVEMKSRSK